LFPENFKLEKISTLLANKEVLSALIAGQDPQRIADGWRDALENFMQRREKALLY